MNILCLKVDCCSPSDMGNHTGELKRQQYSLYSKGNKSQIPLLESCGNAVLRTQGPYLNHYPVVLNCRTTLVHSQKQCLLCVIQTFKIWGFTYNFTYNFTYKPFLKKQIKSLDALHFYLLQHADTFFYSQPDSHLQSWASRIWWLWWFSTETGKIVCLLRVHLARI